MKKVLFPIFLCLAFLSIETKAQTAVTATSTAAVTTPSATVLDTVIVNPYLGKYKSEMGGIKVWIENGQLLGELEGQQSAELRLTDKADVLAIVGMDGDVTFIRDDEKKVIKLKINAQGTTIEGEKVE